MAKNVVVGAHPWVYAARRPQRDIYPILGEIFADMSASGLDGIELMDSALVPDGAVERIGELSREHGLPVIGTSFGACMWDRAKHAEIRDYAKGVVARLAQLGGRTLGVSVGAAPKRKTPEQLDAQADLLREVVALCEAHRVVLNLHNHTYEVQDGLYDLRGTLDRVPEAKLGPDLNWLLRAGVDPVKFLHEFRERIVFLHLRDQHAGGRWSEALGEGDMDYRAISRALREISFAGDVIIELAHERDFEPTRPIGESLKRSRAFVKEVLGY
ncbi:MAG: sugar phosphate isomerase/epimerase [Planctomycetota bacterium]|nr:sugar phosphate isomerase/epimerase [Planctomycetota bacterium]